MSRRNENERASSSSTIGINELWLPIWNECYDRFVRSYLQIEYWFILRKKKEKKCMCPLPCNLEFPICTMPFYGFILTEPNQLENALICYGTAHSCMSIHVPSLHSHVYLLEENENDKQNKNKTFIFKNSLIEYVSTVKIMLGNMP